MSESLPAVLLEFADLLESARAGTLPPLKHPVQGHDFAGGDAARFILLTSEAIAAAARSVEAAKGRDWAISPTLPRAAAGWREVLRELRQQATKGNEEEGGYDRLL